MRLLTTNMFTDKQVSYTCQKSGKTLVSFGFLKPIIAQRLKTKTQTFNIISKTSVSNTGSVSFEPSSRRRSQWADWACRAHIFFTSSVSFLKKGKKKLQSDNSLFNGLNPSFHSSSAVCINHCTALSPTAKERKWRQTVPGELQFTDLPWLHRFYIHL